MIFPWERSGTRPELQKDANGLYSGQQHPLDIPDFLNRAPFTPKYWPALWAEKNASPATNLPASLPNWVPPSGSKS